MSIAEFIRENVLWPRLKESGCLVVYDPSKLYREQCLELRTEKVAVVETSESSIESREAAFRALHWCMSERPGRKRMNRNRQTRFRHLRNAERCSPEMMATTI
jgi:hypothetical protein